MVYYGNAGASRVALSSIVYTVIEGLHTYLVVYTNTRMHITRTLLGKTLLSTVLRGGLVREYTKYVAPGVLTLTGRLLGDILTCRRSHPRVCTVRHGMSWQGDGVTQSPFLPSPSHFCLKVPVLFLLVSSLVSVFLSFFFSTPPPFRVILVTTVPCNGGSVFQGD